MKELAYKAYDAQGIMVEGVTKGRNEKDILGAMHKKGLCIVELNSVGQSFVDQLGLSKLFHRVKIEELIVFTRQFYTLYKAGLSIDTLLGTLIKQVQNPTLKNALTSIRDDIQSGTSLSQAFGKHPKIFGMLYVSMLSAGEEAGILEEVLLELTKVLEKETQIRQEVSSATLYPKIVVGAMLISLYVMLTVIIPKFANFYGKYGADLPLPTRILLEMSNFATHYWYLVFAGLGLGLFLFLRYIRTPRGRLRFDTLKLKTPIFGALFQKIETARFGHVFAALYRSGLAMVRSLEVLSGVMGNQVYVLEIQRIRGGIIQGSSLEAMMKASHYFSPITVETAAIGEKTGNLDEMLSALADHYDLEVRHTTKNLMTLLEPMLLGGIFGMVTLMALAVFLPMWNLSSVVLHNK